MNTTFDNDGMDNATGDTFNEFSDYSQRVVIAVLILIISVVGVIGNSTVHLAVFLSKKLRTPTNAFVVNLAIADLLTCMVIPVNTVALLGMTDPPINEWACKVVGIVQFTTVGCSIFNLASIGVNRLLLITRPTTTYRKVYTPRKIAVWLMLNWLIPFLTSVIPPLAGVGAVGYNRQYHFCGSKQDHPLYMVYNLILALVLYPIPFVAIGISYTMIWRHLRRHAMKLAAKEKAEPKANRYSIPMASQSEDMSTSDQPRASGQGDALGTTSTRKRNRQTEVTKNMLYVVCGFGICLTPYAINLVFDANGPGIPYTTAILLFNNCINPFIYATKHRDFKAVFGCIWRCRWDQVPQPSDALKALRRTTCCGARN